MDMEKRELYEAREKFLQDTIDYYSVDPDTRRCISRVSYRCLYSAVNAGRGGESEGCAIGRHLPNDLAVKLDDSIVTGVDSVDVFTRLPETLKSLGREFLVEIQDLHDTGYNWDRYGLSSLGLVKVEDIRARFLAPPPIE